MDELDLNQARLASPSLSIYSLYPSSVRASQPVHQARPILVGLRACSLLLGAFEVGFFLGVAVSRAF